MPFYLKEIASQAGQRGTQVFNHFFFKFKIFI